MTEKLNVGLIVTLSGRWPRELPIRRHKEYTAWARETLTDMNLIEDCELEKLHGLRAVTLNCVKFDSHHSHFSLHEVLDFFAKVGAQDSYITHISHLLPPHAKFEEILPDGVHPAYDGLIIE